MVLNALEIDPKRRWKGSWRWYSGKFKSLWLAKLETNQIPVYQMKSWKPAPLESKCSREACPLTNLRAQPNHTATSNPTVHHPHPPVILDLFDISRSSHPKEAHPLWLSTIQDRGLVKKHRNSAGILVLLEDTTRRQTEFWLWTLLGASIPVSGSMLVLCTKQCKKVISTKLARAEDISCWKHLDRLSINHLLPAMLVPNVTVKSNESKQTHNTFTFSQRCEHTLKHAHVQSISTHTRTHHNCIYPSFLFFVAVVFSFSLLLFLHFVFHVTINFLEYLSTEIKFVLLNTVFPK